MVKPSILNSSETIRYGLGLETKTDKGLKLVFHGGGDAGWRSCILNVPKCQFSAVILGNSNEVKPFQLDYGILQISNSHEIKTSNPCERFLVHRYPVKSSDLKV